MQHDDDTKKKQEAAAEDVGPAPRFYLLPQSAQRMSRPLATKRLLDRLREHLLQLKQYSCQELPSYFTTFTPLPKPERRGEAELVSALSTF